MGCEYVSSEGNPCQFFVATTFYEFSGKKWCAFHLPMMDEDENWSEKEKWREIDKLGLLNLCLDSRLIEEDGNETFLDLCGIVFPSFTNFNEDNLSSITIKSFDESEFWNMCVFNGRALEGASFEGAHFYDDCFLFDAISTDGFFFKNSIIEGSFSCAINSDGEEYHIRRADFDNVVFKDKVDFANRVFSGSTSFDGTVFYKAPQFHGCKIHQDTSFGGAIFLDVTGKNAPAAYRTLKLAMEQNRAWNDMAMFYALEQRSIRNQSDTPLFTKFISYLYDFASDYGRSIARPLVWFLWFGGVFFALYANLGPFELHVETGQPAEALGFVVEQYVRPFGAWTMVHEDLPVGWKVLGSLQSLIGIGLVTLFILAVRRRFRMA